MSLGQSPNKGWHIVEAILALEKTLAIHDDDICNLEARLLTVGLHDNFVQQDIPAQLNNLRTWRTRISQALTHKKEALGIETRMLLTLQDISAITGGFTFINMYLFQFG